VLRPAREPVAKLAWVVVIFSLPVLGIIAYIFTGEVALGPRRMKRIMDLRRSLPIPPVAPAPKPSAIYANAFRTLAAINELPQSSIASAELLADSNEAVDCLIEDIARAKADVHLGFYIWLPDRNGTKLAQALMAAAARGITVRAMVDAIGSETLLHAQIWKDMVTAGVKIRIMLPRRFNLLGRFGRRIDLRNHRKLIIIDGAIAYIGSQNMADPEFLPKRKFGPWYDVLVRITGDAAAAQDYLFRFDWLAEGDDTFAAAPASRATKPKATAPAQVFGTGPSLPAGMMSDAFNAVLLSARSSVFITTPYFAPDASLYRGLLATARRGVAITLILPRRNDNAFVGAIARSYYAEMLQAGLKIHEFPLGLLHSKTLVADGRLCLFGSANMDRRSLELNFENNILVEDENLAVVLHQRQLEYLQASIPITADDVAATPLIRKLLQNISSMLSPIL
jgi:cardiolipin synthase